MFSVPFTQFLRYYTHTTVTITNYSASFGETRLIKNVSLKGKQLQMEAAA
jgi:hypothetical protein